MNETATDPIVQEVREAGAQFAAECGGDLRVMAARLRDAERLHPSSRFWSGQSGAPRGHRAEPERVSEEGPEYGQAD